MISYHVLPDGKTYAVILELIPYTLREFCGPCPDGYRPLCFGEYPDVGDLSFSFTEQRWELMEESDRRTIEYIRQNPDLFSKSVWLESTVRKK